MQGLRWPVLFLVLLSLNLLHAQTRGNSSRRNSGSPLNTAPANTQPYTQTILSGKVVMSDGSPLPGPVAVISVCNGNSHRETMTMLDGSFSFMPGDRRSSVLADASDTDRTTDPFTGRPSSISGGIPSGPQVDSRSLFGCELRADLPGYESSYLSLSRETPGNFDVGDIVLHSRKAKSAESVVSATTLQAPSGAKKDFEKGRSQLEKGNFTEAEAHFRKAVEQYPKYAEAWFFLGNVRNLQHDHAGARAAYEEAMKADPGYPPPYLRMAQLAAMDRQWEDARSYTDRLLGLDPHNAMACYYNAAANYNLKHIPQAEASALKAESLDSQHHEPRIEILLGLIYMAEQNYSAAAQHYRAYLQLVPNGPQTEKLKTDLAKLEELARAESAKASPPKP